MNVKYGITGLPNVGKSTFFNSLTNLNVPSSNYPFCTIKPNFGKFFFYDERLKILKKKINNIENIKFSEIDIIDIGGLIKGASKNQGLGKEFLNRLKEVNVLIHILRCFKDKEITHINEKINPIRDMEIVNIELILSDLNCINNFIKKNKKIKEIDEIKNILKKINSGLFLRDIHISENVKKIFKNLNLITIKPLFFILNTSENTKNNIRILKKNEIIFKEK